MSTARREEPCSHLAVETGGEAYFLGFGPLPSLAPFLADVSDHTGNQYLIEFVPDLALTPGGFQPVTVKSKIPDVELMAPAGVWVPAAWRSGERGAPSRD
jgi:hypothetical protein